MNSPANNVEKTFLPMAILIENFVAIVVILKIDLVVIYVDKDLDIRELTYQIIMKNVKKMLTNDLISRDEYINFQKKMIAKYKPVIGPIYSDIDLI